MYICLLISAAAMRRETAARSGPSRLHDVLTSYSGPPKITIQASEDSSSVQEAT
jgi:hypothetical protein